MTNEFLLSSMNGIGDDVLEGSEKYRVMRGRKALMGVAALAACTAICVLSAVRLFGQANNEHIRRPIQWSEGFRAEDYFALSQSGNDGVSSSDSLSTDARPWGQERSFGDERAQLEAENAIPKMADYPIFALSGRYRDDGLLHSVYMTWQSYGTDYSDYAHIHVTAGYDEVEEITDCISVAVDDEGYIIEPEVTVVERDGYHIYSELTPGGGRSVVFENIHGWYKIEAFSSVPFEDIALLIDFFWENGLDFGCFPIERGDRYDHVPTSEGVGALKRYLPDFAALGYFEGEGSVTLKNGEPAATESHWYSGIDEQSVLDGTYLEKGGWTELHWCVETAPNVYELSESLGDISELSEAMVVSRLSNESSVSFMVDDVFIRVYTKNASEAWRVIDSMR